MFVDAGWGQGKTTFIRMWSAYLRTLPDGERYTLVDFNTWSSDYSDTPFVPLAKWITSELRSHLGSDERNKLLINNLKKAGREALRMVSFNLVSKATVGFLSDDNVEMLANAIFDENDDDSETIRSFRESLAKASAIIRQDTKKPLILIIDELDRCRPLYAIEMLETIKHLFSVENIVFVLVVNLKELSHSIHAVYGEQFDVDSYLQRFRDIDFRLPDANRERISFINKCFLSEGVMDYAARTDCRDPRPRIDWSKKLYEDFAITYGWSLRDIEQQLKRLEATYSIMRNDYVVLIESFTLLLILRHLDAEALDQLIRGEMTDLEYINSVFGRDSRFDALKGGHRLRIIADIMYGYQRLVTSNRAIEANRSNTTLFDICSNNSSDSRNELAVSLSANDWNSISEMARFYNHNMDNPSISDAVMLLETYRRLEFGSECLLEKEDD